MKLIVSLHLDRLFLGVLVCADHPENLSYFNYELWSCSIILSLASKFDLICNRSKVPKQICIPTFWSSMWNFCWSNERRTYVFPVNETTSPRYNLPHLLLSWYTLIQTAHSLSKYRNCGKIDRTPQNLEYTHKDAYNKT